MGCSAALFDAVRNGNQQVATALADLDFNFAKSVSATEWAKVQYRGRAVSQAVVRWCDGVVVGL